MPNFSNQLKQEKGRSPARVWSVLDYRRCNIVRYGAHLLLRASILSGIAAFTFGQQSALSQFDDSVAERIRQQLLNTPVQQQNKPSKHKLPAAQNEAAKFVLEGTVQHSNALPPVDPRLKPGARFDLKRMPINDPLSLLWWRVPEWLAGTWHNSGKVKRLSFVDLQNPEKKEGFNLLDIHYPDSEIIGYQEDRGRAVWTCVMTPYMGRTKQGENTNVSVIHAAVPMETSQHQVILKFLATTVVIGKNKRIVSVSQRESIQTYRPVDGNKVIVLSSMKFFDDEGIAKYESDLLSHCQRQLPFREVEYLPAPQPLTLIDLRRSFDKYLRSQQMDALIPQRHQTEPPIGYNIIVP